MNKNKFQKNDQHTIFWILITLLFFGGLACIVYGAAVNGVNYL